jgi:hypothetical protein
MLVRKPLIFLTLIFAIMAVFAATEVVAQTCDSGENTADYECNDGVEGNYTVRIVKPFPLIAPCANSSGNCSTWRWEVLPDSLSHFNLVVDLSFGDEIVDSSGDPLSTLLNCDVRGDESQGGSDFARLLMGHCLLKFDSAIHGNSPSLTLRGEFAAAPTTSWYVKQAQCDYGDDCFRGDFGITQGLAEFCGGATGVVTSSRICVNLPGTEIIGDEAHYWFFRNNDIANCVDTTKDLYICFGTCPDRFEDEPSGACEKLTGTPDALHIIGSNLVGNSCPDELFKQTYGNSPFYHYESWVGGYYYEACYDYAIPGWTDVNACP